MTTEDIYYNVVFDSNDLSHVSIAQLCRAQY